MFYRRNSTDAAIGWISTVDSLLLGFGLMVVLSLHTAIKQRGTQATADRFSQELTSQKHSFAEAAAKAKVLEAELKVMTQSRDELAADSERLQEQLAASSHGADGISKKLRGTIVERDLLKTQKSVVEKQVVIASRQLEDVNRKLADATTSISGLRDERDSLAAKALEMQGKLLSMEDQQKKSELSAKGLIQEVEKLRAIAAGNSRELDNLRQSLQGRERDLRGFRADAAAAAASMNIALQKNEEVARTKGQAAATEVLGFKGKFSHVVFVIDISHSMTHISDPKRPGFKNDKYDPKRWDKTKREIVSWANHLPMETLRLVFFHSKVFEHPGGGKFYSMKDMDRGEAVSALKDLLDRLKPTSQTNTLAALQAAYSYPGIDTIVLFTDGSPLVEGTSSSDLVARVHRLVEQHQGIPVNVVGIGEYFERSFADFLRGIAGTTGGEFIGR